MLFLKQEIDDPDSTLLSNAADEETNSKSGMGDDGFEVVTLESDYQVIRCMDSQNRYPGTNPEELCLSNNH